MKDVLRWQAPAKINLFLNVIGRRNDGYHLLQTVFQFIDLCDQLQFHLTSDGEITRLPGNSPVPAKDDILIAAAARLQKHGQVSQGVSIEIDKRIPIGGGLGGGSSNAATCLLALNQLWGLDLPLRTLADIGLELGADVPVFIHGEAAWASGIGEQLEALELYEPYMLIIDPGTPVSTAQIFADRELTRQNDPITIRAFLQGSTDNVCEPVVRRHYPQVAQALDWLNLHRPARMTGTGACVFATVDSMSQAEELKSRVPKRWTAFVVKAINRNPVHRQLQLTK